MRALKLLSAVAAVVALMLSASSIAAAAPARPGGGSSAAACGTWVGTFHGQVTSTGGWSVDVRAVIYPGGGDVKVDTYADGKLEGVGATPWYDVGAIRWNTDTNIGPMLYSFGPATTCSGDQITEASAFRQWFWPCCYNWTGTVNREA